MAKAENSVQQNVLSRKIEDMSRTTDETLSKYVTQSNNLHAELLRMQGFRERSPENRPCKDTATPNPKREVSVASAQNAATLNPKREVSVASTSRSMSPGTIQIILTAIERMEQRIAGLSERVDKSNEKGSSGHPIGEPARGRSITRRNPDDPDDEGDDSDDSSDSDFPEGENPDEGDDPEGDEDRNPTRININPLRGESQGKTINETRRFKEHDTVKVPKFPSLHNLSAWKLQVGKNLVAAGGRIDQRENAWWAEVSKETSTFDSLADSGEDRFVSLGLKLSISPSISYAQGG